MSDGGYIKLYRKSIKNKWLEDPYLWTFWTWCLLTASYKPHDERVGYQMVHLEPGQFLFSFRKAAAAIRVDPQRIRTFVAFLKKSENLTQQSTHRYTIITITNWVAYQSDSCDANTQDNTVQTQSKHSPNTALIKERIEKKGKEGKEQHHPKPAASDPDFDKFWSAYPRKDDKKGAMKAWAKCNGNRPAIDVIVAKVEAFKKSDQWTRDSGQFIPMPTTFINRERWNDEGATVKPYEFKLNLRRNENESR